MVGFVFRNRWVALLWAFGIVWLADTFLSPSPGGKAPEAQLRELVEQRKAKLADAETDDEAPARSTNRGAVDEPTLNPTPTIRPTLTRAAPPPSYEPALPYSRTDEVFK